MKKLIASASALLLPVVTFAATAAVSDLESVNQAIRDIANVIIPILITIGVIVIIWGTFQMVINPDDEDTRKTARSVILWGVVGLFLMVSVWGIINLLFSIVALDTTPVNLNVSI